MSFSVGRYRRTRYWTIKANHAYVQKYLGSSDNICMNISKNPCCSISLSLYKHFFLCIRWMWKSQKKCKSDDFFFKLLGRKHCIWDVDVSGILYYNHIFCIVYYLSIVSAIFPLYIYSVSHFYYNPIIFSVCSMSIASAFSAI